MEFNVTLRTTIWNMPPGYLPEDKGESIYPSAPGPFWSKMASWALTPQPSLCSKWVSRISLQHMRSPTLKQSLKWVWHGNGSCQDALKWHFRKGSVNLFCSSGWRKVGWIESKAVRRGFLIHWGRPVLIILASERSLVSRSTVWGWIKTFPKGAVLIK